MDPQLLGPRLREARRAAGATQQAIAERLGLARTTLVAIESGQRRVTPHELIQLAQSYGRSVSELVRPDTVVAVPVAQFRADFARQGEVGDKSPQLLADMASDFVALERLRQVSPLGQMPPEYRYGPIAPERTAEAAASAERNRLGMGDGPVGNLRERLASDAGLRIFLYPMPSSVAGLFFYHPELGACVGLNAHHPAERRRWTLVHEYAHLLFSRYRAEVTRVGKPAGKSVEERLADAFARHFLMPSAGLSRRVNELRAQRGADISVADACRLARLYRVSVQALVLRLEELNEVPGGTWNRLMDEGFRPRLAQAELGIPQPLAEPRPLPARYLQLAAEAYLGEQISEEQLARYLRVDRVAARAQLAAITRVPRDGAAGDFTPVSLPLDRRLGAE